MSLTANPAYPPHARINHHHHHQQQQQQQQQHPYHPHDSLPTSSSEQSHPLYIQTAHLHSHQQQQAYPAPAYHAPSPPYSSHPQPPPPHRASSIEPNQKPILPYPTVHHDQKRLYSTSAAYRPHPYSPPTLPPLTVGRPPLSPQSPNDAPLHYSLPERHTFRTESPMSPSPPPSSSSSTSYGATNASGADNGDNGAPLSTHDRRERNKAASAKYRAKKHYQSGEMRQQITVLQDQNNVLTRQLQETRTENSSLKNTIEKLRGRLVAEKVLRRLREVGREKRRDSSSGGSKVSVHDLASGSEDEDDDDEIGDIEEDEDDVDGELQQQDVHRPEKRSKPNPRHRTN
ncbi:hypothetical protein KI688_004504 [Linnemannia hyalina]|uniref:BZIP domain-containing protein n=1 Tax=Linnemannia hyalina TaxID=64524 RepID=A0A9P8BRG0_9FUNG|nr:hypothetical protein KI688_004504 [Linnemannia hyalina]